MNALKLSKKKWYVVLEDTLNFKKGDVVKRTSYYKDPTFGVVNAWCDDEMSVCFRLRGGYHTHGYLAPYHVQELDKYRESQ